MTKFDVRTTIKICAENDKETIFCEGYRHGGLFRDWSLITGRGVLQNGRGGAREVLPLRKGGAEKVLAMLKGGHKKFWGSFYVVA